MKVKSTLDKTVQRALIALLLVCVIGLLIEMTREYTLVSGTAGTVVRAPLSPHEDAGLTLAPLAEYAEIIERPLFMDTRRPYVPEEEVVQVKKAERAAPVRNQQAANFLLSAIIITDEKRIALIQSGREKKLHKLSMGDDLDGWKMTELNPESISLSKGSEIKTLELIVKRSAKQPTRGRQQKTGESNGSVTILENEEADEEADEEESGAEADSDLEIDDEE